MWGPYGSEYFITITFLLNILKDNFVHKLENIICNIAVNPIITLVSEKYGIELK